MIFFNHIKLLDSFDIRSEAITPAGYDVFESRSPGNIYEKVPVYVNLHAVPPG